MIPILDLKAQYESIKDEINAAMAVVLESAQFILGPAVRDLEQRVAAYCGCKYGVGVGGLWHRCAAPDVDGAGHRPGR